MKHLSDQALLTSFETLVKQEKRVTAEVVAHLHEIGARKLYLRLGHKNLFTYLTKGLGYTPASAQRRIDAARLLEVVPEVKRDLEEGAINLSQISLLAQGFRRKEGVTASEKRELVERVKQKELPVTEILVSQALNLPVAVAEKVRHQKDESVRLEITLSKSEMDRLRRVKEVISHRSPSISWGGLINLLVSEFLKRKDPMTLRNFRSEVPPRQSKASLRYEIFSRDQACQWVNPVTREKCGSRFQLQIHHIQPRSAGGKDEPTNLKLLCSIHHQLTHEKPN